MWSTNKIYELFKLQIEALNARVENNELQIRKLFEMIDELRKHKQEISAPTDIKAYGFDENNNWYEIDKEGNAKSIKTPELKKKEGD